MSVQARPPEDAVWRGMWVCACVSVCPRAPARGCSAVGILPGANLGARSVLTFLSQDGFESFRCESSLDLRYLTGGAITLRLIRKFQL